MAKQKRKQPAQAPTLTLRHKWTNGGSEVLLIKCVEPDGTAYGGFKWPLKVGAQVYPGEWSPEPECGNGLHGWPWGFGIVGGKIHDWSCKWIVFGAPPEDVVELVGGKAKARFGIVRFVGDWASALAFILPGQMAWIKYAARGAASATGMNGAAFATGMNGAAFATGANGAASATGERGVAFATGWSGAASATDERGVASATGWSGAASATGWSGAASATGERGVASATGTDGSASATGENGAAVVTGLRGRARAGAFGCVALAWKNEAENRIEMRCARVGCGDGSDGLLKAGIWYTLNSAGTFIEVRAD